VRRPEIRSVARFVSRYDAQVGEESESTRDSAFRAKQSCAQRVGYARRTGPFAVQAGGPARRMLTPGAPCRDIAEAPSRRIVRNRVPNASCPRGIGGCDAPREWRP